MGTAADIATRSSSWTPKPFDSRPSFEGSVLWYAVWGSTWTTGDRAEAGRLLALGSVVPGVVHELNNALLGLLGMIELAQADATGPVADRLGIAQQAGEEIRDVARVLGALAREPLDGGRGGRRRRSRPTWWRPPGR